MSVLWYAIAIYMIGIAVVLYVRPKVMFRENGMWKEFGLATESDQTIFPFWMFALIWAILSYALATLALMFFASVTLKSTDLQTTNNSNNLTQPSFMQPISSYPNMPMMPTASNNGVPMSTMGTMGTMGTMPTFTAPPAIPNMGAMTAAAAARPPGYYILDPYANPAQPRYIYYGTDPPGTV